ncbi:MAG: phosphoadenylyl-sulfate reductase [Rhodobiaceae bacterium]|nr:phosphoadenylyl-sulfate reductase [Rhodobiaceae bacterium]
MSLSLAQLQRDYGHLGGGELLGPMIRDVFPGRIALVSSFGAESAILAHMVARIDPATAILFVDTGRLFPETLAYRDTLIERLGLTNVRTVAPSPSAIAAQDPHGELYSINSDACCEFRKVEVMEKGLRGFSAWITGRKRYHGGERSALAAVEHADWRIKVNPLAAWTPQQLAEYFKTHGLPAHPLVAQGYPSIGCVPCTSQVAEGEDARAGRWRGQEKTECGIHWSVDGKPIRPSSPSPSSAATG